MQEFKQVVKMKCGGSVNKAVEKCSGGRMKTGGKVEHDDTKEDKKLIKKAFNLHDDQKHEGKTDLSKLKKGGRCKKEGGNVRKYKCGGEVKKMAIGGLTDPTTQALVNADVLKRRKMAQMGAGAAGLGAANAVPPAMGQQAPNVVPQGLPQPAVAPDVVSPGPVMKRGGKVKKGCK